MVNLSVLSVSKAKFLGKISKEEKKRQSLDNCNKSVVPFATNISLHDMQMFRPTSTCILPHRGVPKVKLPPYNGSFMLSVEEMS